MKTFDVPPKKIKRNEKVDIDSYPGYRYTLLQTRQTPRRSPYRTPIDIYSDKEEQNREVYEMASVSYLAHFGPHG